MSETRFWLIRHAESTWNAAGRWQGQADPPLSARGRDQAALLAAELADQGLELLVSSDLLRTSQTAAIVGRQLGLEPRHEPGLRELDAGSWSGLSREEIALRDGPALARFDTGDPEAAAGGAESRRDAAGRARCVLGALAAERGERRVAVVTHSGVIGALLPEFRAGHAGWRVAPAGMLLSASAEAS